MLRAMLKQLTVVGEANMTNMVTKSSPRHPIQMASGKNAAAKRISLNAVQTNVGFKQAVAFFKSMDAPSAMSPNGVAVAAREETEREKIVG